MSVTIHRDTTQRDRVLERVLFQSRDALRAHAFALRDEITSTLERHRVGTGTHYSGNPNPSSSPGDPPARQTGRLLNSIQARERTPELFEVGPAHESFVGRAEYPVFLEFGTVHMEPRPFMRPSVAGFRAELR